MRITIFLLGNMPTSTCRHQHTDINMPTSTWTTSTVKTSETLALLSAFYICSFNLKNVFSTNRHVLEGNNTVVIYSYRIFSRCGMKNYGVDGIEGNFPHFLRLQHSMIFSPFPFWASKTLLICGSMSKAHQLWHSVVIHKDVFQGPWKNCWNIGSYMPK